MALQSTTVGSTPIDLILNHEIKFVKSCRLASREAGESVLFIQVLTRGWFRSSKKICDLGSSDIGAPQKKEYNVR